MIDNIRFNFTFKPDNAAKYLESLSENLTLNQINRNGDVKGYSGNLYLVKGVLNLVKEDGSEGRKYPVLRIGIFLYKDGNVKVTIMNSLRKWYSNDQLLFEFTKKEFKKCLNLIADKLKVGKEIIRTATVTQVEYGSHISLRPEFRCFTTCLYGHKHIPTKMIFDNETLQFVGEYKKVVFYDKVAEDGNKTSRYSAKNRKKIMSKALTLRYEIAVTKVSGEKFAKNNMGTLIEIIDNWKKIVENWVAELENVIFVNNMSPTIYRYLEDSQITEMNDYLIYLGIETLGVEKMNALLKDRALKLKRSLMTDKYVQIFNKMKNMVEEEDFEFLFREKVREQSKRIL